MSDVAAFWQREQKEAGKDEMLYLEWIIRYKHRDLLLMLTLILGFGILFVFSVMG
ncbi:MAG: hypothetical protein A4E49_03222 [Methanosaeta sp. PtaU1.Bin112]|nr:MAG: hypothetical protein A4E49_03222 [Methanosaeta sp. PtaU1.Bin112]